MANTNNRQMMLMWGALLIVQYSNVLTADYSNDDSDNDVDDTPAYRAPIAYERKVGDGN